MSSLVTCCRSLPEVPASGIRRHLRLPPRAPVDARVTAAIDVARIWFERYARPWSVRLRSDELEVVVASAGPEVDGRIDRCCRDGRPDAALHLHARAVATVEALRRLQVAAALRDARTRGRRARLYRTRHDHDTTAELFELLTSQPLPGPLERLASGQLRPLRSWLAALDVTEPRR